MAQQAVSFKVKTYRFVPDTLVLDTLSLVPGSVSFVSFPLRERAFSPKIDYQRHALIFFSKPPDSLVVRYQTFPYNFEKSIYHKNPAIVYQDLSGFNKPYTIFYDDKKSGVVNDFLFQNDGLNKNGSISRGISFGNNQDLSVNSNLNLQVSGKLSPEIDMVLAATDNNIPFQADGTTAQLQEFDKVFVQLNNADTRLVVGDYQLSRPENSYFMNYYKRTQGILLENKYVDSALKKPLTFKTSVSGAVSRGKFSRQVFFGNENNQGPYRLRGADNEPFIVVLSGTEKIYVDGKLLQRGQENDYIIDYNTSELTFTARQLMTKDKRVVAEFQYAERNYARSLFFFGEEMSAGKTKMYLNVYSEQDNKNRPLQQTLSQEQKNTLIAIGDTLEKAVSSGVEEATFNNSDVFYRKRDTLVNAVLYPSVYVYSINPDSAKYRLKFSQVGVGNGNYVQVTGGANGRVFKWVAPVNGVKQGAYEPVITLVTPKRTQMVTAGVQYSLQTQHVLQVEGAYTKNDLNSFSAKDTRDDEAGGFKLLSKNEAILKKDSLGQITKFIYNTQYEFLQKQFKQIERFRSIEFERDWNRPLNAALFNDQHIGGAELGFVHKNTSQIFYTISGFKEAKNYEGIKQQLNTSYTFKKFQAGYNGSYLKSRDTASTTNFYRHKTNVAQTIKGLRVSWNDELENNLFSKSSVLQQRTYQFWEWEAAISNADTVKNRFRLFYRERNDRHVVSDVLTDSTKARNIGMQTQINSIKNNPVAFLFTYRELSTRKLRSNIIKPDNTLLGRIEYNPRYWQGFITANTFYETGYGLENKREFYYLEVAASQGTYAWNDYNKNGIKELNEFEIAQFQDQARYIRIYVPTNNYVKVLQNQLSFAFNIKPSALLQNKKSKLAKFTSRWATQTSFRVDNRTTDDGRLYAFNPWLTTSDTLLIANNNNIRQSIFFNQSSAVFSMDYTFLNNSGKQLLTNGIEARELLSHQVKGRFTFLKNFILQSENTLGQKRLSSQLFASRNYAIQFLDLAQQISYQPNTLFRISAGYKYSDKQNRPADITLQTSRSQDVNLEVRWNSSEKGNISVRFDYIFIAFNDDANSPVAYEMLNALLPGNNFTWNLNFQRNITSNIQISINYDGRKNQTGKIVHIGGAQVRAFF